MSVPSSVTAAFVPPEREVGVDARLVGARQQVLEALGRQLHAAFAWHVGEGDVTGPETDRFLEPSCSDDVVAVVERSTSGVDELFEPVRVDIVRRDIEHVARRRRPQALGAHDLAHRRDPGLQGVGGSGRHGAGPQLIDERVGAHWLARGQRQQREQRALLLTRYRDAATAVDEGDRSEQRHTHDGSVRIAQASVSGAAQRGPHDVVVGELEQVLGAEDPSAVQVTGIGWRRGSRLAGERHGPCPDPRDAG